MLVEDFVSEIEKQVDGFSTRVNDATRGLSHEQINWSPKPSDQWSVAQILKHMMISNRLYIPPLQVVLKEAEMGQPRDTIRHTWFGKKLAAKAGPGGNAPVHPIFKPGNGPFDLDVVQHYLRQQDELRILLTRAADKDICRTKIRNPVVNIFRMNVADVFRTLERHSEHHVKQIEILVRDSRFPKDEAKAPVVFPASFLS